MSKNLNGKCAVFEYIEPEVKHRVGMMFLGVEEGVLHSYISCVGNARRGEGLLEGIVNM